MSFESWKQNLLYILSLDREFTPYLRDGATWGKRTAGNPNRGFADDGAGVDAADRKTAAEKVSSFTSKDSV